MGDSPEPIAATCPFTLTSPLLRQSWLDLTFLHWSYPAEVIRPLVPAGLELDLWNGRAWVGLVPFLLSGLTFAKAPEIPWLSTFPETNVRTYVYDRSGRRGVWFFTLEAARLAAVAGARASYALPYQWARMSIEKTGDAICYTSRRIGVARPASTEIVVRPSIERLEAPDAMTDFLTARWRLFASRRGRLLRADVEHDPWPLYSADAVEVKESVLTACGLPAPEGEPHTLFSPGVFVWTSGLMPVNRV